MWRIACLALWVLVVSPPSAHAQGGKDTLSVDLLMPTSPGPPIAGIASNLSGALSCAPRWPCSG